MKQTLLGKNDHKGLRRFAAMMMWAFPLFFSLLIPWLFSYSLQWWPLVVSLVFALLYAFTPGLIYYPYRGWMALAGVIGWINTRLILGITYYGLILPIGILLRVTGKLQYKHSVRAGDSYYLPSESTSDKERLERPF
jgi:hypothetical protein